MNTECEKHPDTKSLYEEGFSFSGECPWCRMDSLRAEVEWLTADLYEARIEVEWERDALGAEVERLQGQQQYVCTCENQPQLVPGGGDTPCEDCVPALEYYIAEVERLKEGEEIASRAYADAAETVQCLKDTLGLVMDAGGVPGDVAIELIQRAAKAEAERDEARTVATLRRRMINDISPSGKMIGCYKWEAPSE